MQAEYEQLAQAKWRGIAASIVALEADILANGMSEDEILALRRSSVEWFLYRPIGQDVGQDVSQ